MTGHPCSSAPGCLAGTAGLCGLKQKADSMALPAGRLPGSMTQAHPWGRRKREKGRVGREERGRGRGGEWGGRERKGEGRREGREEREERVPCAAVPICLHVLLPSLISEEEQQRELGAWVTPRVLASDSASGLVVTVPIPHPLCRYRAACGQAGLVQDGQGEPACLEAGDRGQPGKGRADLRGQKSSGRWNRVLVQHSVCGFCW